MRSNILWCKIFITLIMLAKKNATSTNVTIDLPIITTNNNYTTENTGIIATTDESCRKRRDISSRRMANDDDDYQDEEAINDDHRHYHRDHDDEQEEEEAKDTIDTKAMEPKIDYWGGYYDFLVNEGSYKFWAVFQLATAALLIYSGFAALYYAKVNPMINDDYDDFFARRRKRSLLADLPREREFFGFDPESLQRILDALVDDVYR